MASILEFFITIFGVLIILSLIVHRLERKWWNDEKEVTLKSSNSLFSLRDISSDSDEKRYKSILEIEQYESSETIAIVGYSDTKHDIDSFFANCNQVDRKSEGIIILKEGKSVFLPMQSIKQITLITTEKNETAKPCPNLGHEEQRKTRDGR